MTERQSTANDVLRPSGFPRSDVNRRRLGVFALLIGTIIGSGIVIAILFLSVVEPPPAFQQLRGQRIAIGVTLAVLSLAMYAAVRAPSLSNRLVNNLGVGYLAVLVFATGMARYSLPRDSDYVAYGVSFSCVVILLFPLVVNNPVGRAIGVAFLAASMEPLALLVSTLLGQPAPSLVSTVSLLTPTFLCAGLASMPAWIISRLERDVESAERLGSYRLGRQIGSGGMGEVYRAEHRMLARPAAIKIIHPQRIGEVNGREKVLERFEREAQATALLASPHTVDLFDFGTTDDGRFYYVMELLDGVDLHTLIERFGPIPADRAVYFLEQVCDSLIDAHLAGLIHRDIKPANIFTCRYGYRVDFIKVLDFGLVKPQGEASSELLASSGEHMTIGTPAFLAPEVALGSVLPHPRLDLYGVGCVAYWLVTGQMVFDGGAAMDLALKHLKEPVIPPSQRTELPVPDSLEHIILQCLEKDPKDRPESARALLALLRSTGLAADWTEERAREWWHQHLPEGTTTARFEGESPAHLVPRRRAS